MNNNNNEDLFGPGGNTPIARTLDQAISTGNIEEVRTVLQAARNFNGRTAILSVINEPINVDGNMLTPLHLTLHLAKRGDITQQQAFDILRLLLQSGARWNKKNSTGKTPLEMAKEEKMLNAAYLIAGASRNPTLVRQMIKTRKNSLPKSILAFAAKNTNGLFTPAVKNAFKEYTQRRKHILHARGVRMGTIRRNRGSSSSTRRSSR